MLFTAQLAHAGSGLQKESFGSIEKNTIYWNPFMQRIRRYIVPADNQDVIRKMQPVLTVGEVYELIDSLTRKPRG